LLRPGRPESLPAVRPEYRVERILRLPDGFADLAADAQGDNQRMLIVLQEDWEAGTLRFDGWGEALFALHRGDALLGIAGLTPDPYAKGDVVGRVRRFYILRAARGNGAGQALLQALAREAENCGYPRLRVRAPASAFRFYEGCGFLRSVGEKGATHVLPLGLAPTSAALPGRP
jgi:GNAT superfamily N-acetyltransferase